MFLIAEVPQFLEKFELSLIKYELSVSCVSQFSRKSLPVSGIAACIPRKKPAFKILKALSSPSSPESIRFDSNEGKSSRVVKISVARGLYRIFQNQRMF